MKFAIDRGSRRSLTAISFALTLVAGIATCMLLVRRYGFSGVAAGLSLLGWRGFIAVLVMQLTIVVGCGLAWFALIPATHQSSLWTCVLGRLVRNGASEIFFLPHVGGFAMGARAASVAGLPGEVSFASTLVDVTMELLAQAMFVALGLALFARHHVEATMVSVTMAGLAVAVLVAIAFAAAQVRGFEILERIIQRLGHPQLSSNTALVGGAISQIYSRPFGMIQGLGMHFLCWMAGAAQAWVALKLMRANISLDVVLAIESLLCAARAAAFAVPAALGVQEGTYVVLAASFGIAPDMLLALSLLKRVRDSVLGVPPLLIWQAIESKRLGSRLARLERTHHAPPSPQP